MVTPMYPEGPRAAGLSLAAFLRENSGGISFLMSIEQQPAIEFRNVSVGFDDVEVLKNISFTLKPGEMVCITGDSGSGKSVLLRLALGFLQPNEGQILVDGQDITTMDEEELLDLRREKLGMVFQENSLFSGQTVFDNASYRLTDLGLPVDEVEQAVIEILTFVGLQEELEKPAEELSGGMKRRLELARALIGWPSIMLLDEPTAGLDPINAHQVLDLIIRARDLHGTSSLFVTKALHEIPYLARHRAKSDEKGGRIEETEDYVTGVRVILVEDGRIAFSGGPREFNESQLPAVEHMLHPVTDAIHGEANVADPWQRNRKRKKTPN